MPPAPRYPGAYIEELPSGVRTLTGVPTSTTAFIGSAMRGPADLAVRVQAFSEYERTFGGLSRAHPMSYAVNHFFQNGGADALIVRVIASNTDGDDGATIADAEISDPSLELTKRGIWALEREPIFNLLVIPPFTLEAGGDIGAQTRSAAAAYCRKRRAFYIVDPLTVWDEPPDLLGGANSLSQAVWGLDATENAALFFPRLLAPDPLQGGRLADFAPSGAVAGVYARTDTERGVWKAPAGTDVTLHGVSGLTVNLTDGQTAQLNPRGVNCLRTLPQVGPVVWGARTLRGADSLASEWKYGPVRRLALFIEESLLQGTQWVVFEQGDEPLWAKIRLELGTFMQTLFRQGALQGSSPRDAYFVKCDRETTTQADMDLGVVNIIVGFAPLKPAEFVIIKLQQMTGQVA
jgi:phage tail sheath protein FI